MTPPLIPLTPRQVEKARAQRARIVKAKVQRKLSMAEDAAELPTPVSSHLTVTLLRLTVRQSAKALGIHETTVRDALRRTTAADKAQAKQWLELLERAHPEEPWWKK